MDLMHMWEQMGWVAKAIGVILIIMSMISFGVAIERIYTFSQAAKQSKLYAPQVAKHLKERPAEGCHRDFLLEELPLQPPGESRPRRAAGIPVPEG